MGKITVSPETQEALRKFGDMIVSGASRLGYRDAGRRLVDQVMAQFASGNAHPMRAQAELYAQKPTEDEDEVDDWTHEDIRNALADAFLAGFDYAQEAAAEENADPDDDDDDDGLSGEDDDDDEDEDALSATRH